MKKPSIIKSLMLLFAVAAPGALQAANVSLSAADAVNTSSFNSAGKWSNTAVPSAGNDYYTGAYFLRTPADTGGGFTYTFAGNSLTLQQPTSSGVRSVIVKSSNNDTFVINNLTNAFGGILENGGSGNVVSTFTGNLWTIAGNSAVMANQGSLIIGSPLVGASGVILTNGGGNAAGITYNGDNSAFHGIFYLTTISFGNGGGNTPVILNAANSQPANPATFTPNQIWISGGCTLQDNASQTFSNANGGFTLAGNATINAAGATVIAEPITDNGSNYTLTTAGSGSITISTPSAYGGGTVVSAGILRIGVANALTNNGSVTLTGILDLNGFNTTINSLTGAGYVDTFAGGTPTLTIGANGGGGTLAGYIQNSSGTLSVTKVGAGTETFSGGYYYSGTTTVAGGTLNLTTAAGLPGNPGDLVVSNSAVLALDASSGNSLPVKNLVLGNSTNNITYGTLTANPANPAFNASGSLSAPGSSIVINIAATGLRPGTITLIKYTGATLASIANFQVSPPPGVAAILVNNTANHSLDLQITSIPKVLSWNGVNGSSWDLSTPNWLNALTSGITVFQQYTNNGVVAGDAVTFDDTLTNDFVNPQPTNITLNSTFSAFPVVVNTTLPYKISGAGGISGVTSLAISNSGSLTLLTSNSFTGGTVIAGSTLIITNDSALGASSGAIQLNSATLQLNGPVTNTRAISMPVVSTIGVATNVTATLGGVISGGGASLNKTGNGTLVLTGRETITGDLFLHGGFTTLASGGSITNGSYDDVGQNGNDAATLTMTGTGALSTTSDFNLGDLDNSSGTLNMSGSATLVMNALFIGSANAAGSTASGVINQSGGTITEISTAVGSFSIGGRTSASGVGVYNMSGGTVTAGAGIRVGGTGIGTLNQSGGQINALGGLNIARIAGSYGTNNLNGGILSTFNIASSTGTNAIFNFNGGTLQAAFNPPTPWFSGLQSANVLAGGAIIDSSNYNVTITQPLLAGSANGGLTKKGTGTLTLSGVNTFTGPITNLTGILILNSASTYAGGAAVNGGTLQMTPASTIQGTTMISNNAVLSIVQQSSADATLGNLTFNGAASGQGGALALTPATANNPAVPMVNCGTLTLNGTNTINLGAANVGTLALIKYTGAIAGSGNCTNLVLPQGGTGYISNNAAASTLYAVVTSTGPGLIWTGTNSAALNAWNINATTNWLVGAVPTSYHQIIIPGDAVTFNDSGNSTVVVNTNVSPAGLVISNNLAIYAFSGSGSISGPTSLQKLGTGAAILTLTNNTYSGGTIVNGGTLQLGVASALPTAGNLVVGTNGIVNLAGFTETVSELTGAGYVDNSGGNNAVLTVGSSSGGTWTGTITNTGGGGLALHKTGTGTWVVGGKNYLTDGQSFSDVNQINQGTTIITNGGLLNLANLQCQIASVAGQSAAVVVAGGTLIVTNNVLSVGYGATANGTLTVNSGTVDHSGFATSAFAAVANSIDVGAQGSTGTLIVNGGQVLNNQPLFLGDGAGSIGTLQLNGGVVQASQVQPNGAPTTSTIYFNGGTLRAATNSPDFILSTPLVQSGGAILDDGGFAVNIVSQSIQDDPASTGGTLIKKGTGTLYLDAGNIYTGTTVVTNGTLAGVGGISGPVVVGPAGNIGAGDASGTGTLTIQNTPLTLHGNATFRISKTGGSPASDLITGISTVVYGGTLTVTNVTADATTFVAGDTFTLFTASTPSGNFASIVGSPGTGLAYSFNPASGVLSIVANNIASNSTNITFSVSSGTLNLSWPADHLGWILQSQTNALSTGLSTNWVDVAGSSSTTSSSFTMNPAKATVFFRLRHP